MERRRVDRRSLPTIELPPGMPERRQGERRAEDRRRTADRRRGLQVGRAPDRRSPRRY